MIIEIKKIDDASTLTIYNDKFLITTNISDNDNTNHEFTFKFPIFLKYINDFFRKIDIINFAELDINSSYENSFIFKRANSTFKLISSFLYVNEIKFSKSDDIRYLKMLHTGYIKKINFLENTIRIFENIPNGRQDFHLTHIRDCNSVYFYGVLNSRINGDYYRLPNKKFKNMDCLINDKKLIMVFQMIFILIWF